MIKSYRRSRAFANGDYRVIFKPHDQVLLRKRAPGKMACKAHGPFIFKGYKNSSRVVSIIETVSGKRLEVSSHNLLPLQGKPR